MNQIIKHGISLSASLDPSSQQEMRTTLEKIFSDAGNELNFDTPENKKDIMALAAVFRDMFESVGNTKIDFAKIMGLSSGNEMFKALKGSVNELSDVWSKVVGKMGSNSLASIFMKDQSAIDGALSRITTAQGKIKSTFAKAAKSAFAEEKSTDINRLLENARDSKDGFNSATSWEQREAAALRYLNVYRRIMEITQGRTNVGKISPNLQSVYDGLDQLGPYATQNLEEVKAYMQTSLQNIFNLAGGKSLIGLTAGGAVNFDVAPRLIKTLDVGDVLGGKQNINIPVIPEIDPSFKAKLDKLRDLYAKSNDSNEAYQQFEQFQEEMVSGVPAEMQEAAIDRLFRFAELSKVAARNYNAIWKDFIGYGYSTGTGGLGFGGGSGTGDGTGDGTGGGTSTGTGDGTGDRTSEDVENARRVAEYEAKARAEAEAKEQADRRRAELVRQLEGVHYDEYYSNEELEAQKVELQSILDALKQENLLTDEIQAKYNAINQSIQEQINLRNAYASAEQTFNQLDDMSHIRADGSEIDDPDELQRVLDARKELMSSISELAFENDPYSMFHTGDSNMRDMAKAEQVNASLERRIELLRQVKQGLIDLDSVDDIMNETGNLESKLERLGTIAQDWGSKVKDSELDGDDDAIESLEQFEQVYDRIVLKLANGKNIEILPNAKGLRALYKYADGIDPSAYGESEIADVEFVRKEIDAAALAQEKLNAKRAEFVGQLDKLGSDSNEISTLEENLAKRKEIFGLLQQEDLLTDEIRNSYDAVNKEIQEKISLLKQANTNNSVASIGGTGTGTGTGTSAEEIQNLELIRSKVAEITSAVNTKTQAFFDEQSAVKRVVQSEVHALGEVEKRVNAVRVALSNMQAGKHAVNIEVAGGENVEAITTKEMSALQKLRASINLTTKAVDAKTGAFNLEGSTVGKVIGKEVSGLMRLKTQVGEVNTQVLDLLKNLQTTKTSGGAVVVPQTTKSAAGTTKTTSTQSTSNQPDALFDARVETQFSSLSLLYSQLESTGKLTDVVEKEWLQLWDSLSAVKDPAGLQLWRQQLIQVKNNMQEIAIANKLVADEGKASFQQLIGVTKLYNQMAIGAQKAPTQELKSFYTAEANQLLVEQQRLLSGIVMTESQQAKFDELEAARKREINKITAQMSGAERARQDARAAQEQADVLDRLVKLYTEYGALKERAGAVSGTNMASQLNAEADDILAKIQVLRQMLPEISTEMQAAFDGAFATGKEGEANKQYRSYAASFDAESEKERSAIVKELSKDYERLGQMRAQAEAVTGSNEKQFLEEKVRLLEESIRVRQQGLGLDQQLYDAKALEAYYRELEKINRNAARRKDKDTERAQKQAFNDQIAQSQKDAKLNRASSAYERGTGVLTNAMQIDSISPEQEATLQRYNAALEKLRTLRDSAKESGVVTPQQQQEIIAQTQHVNTLTTEVQELVSNYERLSGANSAALTGPAVAAGASSDTIKQALTDAVMLDTHGRASIKGFNYETNELTYTLKGAKGELISYTAAVRQSDGAMRTIRTSSTRMLGVFESIGRKIKEYSYYFTGSMMIYRAIAWVREGITAIKDIDTALTELKKVTDATEESYEKFAKTAAKTADKVGSTIKEVISSTADWARLGSVLAKTSISPII